MAAATAMSHLSNAAVNLVSLREYARKELVKLLESVKVFFARGWPGRLQLHGD